MVSRRSGPAFSRNLSYENFVSETVTAGTSDYDFVKLLASRCSNPFPVESLPDELRQRIRFGIRGEVCFGEVADYLDEVADANNMEWWLAKNGSLNFGSTAPDAIKRRVSFDRRSEDISRIYEELGHIELHCKGLNTSSENYFRGRFPDFVTLWQRIDMSTISPQDREDYFCNGRPAQASAEKKFEFIGKLFGIAGSTVKDIYKSRIKKTPLNAPPSALPN
jgi:hypothetical protein